MPKITRIVHKEQKNRHYVYVDGEYCTSIRDRTFPALNLSEGMEISCERIKELESFHWKEKYGEDSWAREQVRLDRVIELLCSIDSRVRAKKVGFGADNTVFIAAHPEVSGSPDLSICLNDHQELQIMMVEVTGTERRRGSDYWVRPDKLDFCRNNPKKDIWIVLHYRDPDELFVFIRPNNKVVYSYQEVQIANSIEHFVIFSDQSPEVISVERFSTYLKNKINKVEQRIKTDGKA
jgi:hypothetical protein